eukprot:gnl/MRDRNA2_/MRDRNA2_15130_c0_seq1.p1 gnl/MRDRNA2_/MRDRNA2_15130_c0~~gnl/MRDRNA2_/MRDRNA2_15130_c0_seq1.p1  ORF type:complete len:306 (+),score=49.29 gnl/MRDRNA2_/MRDRNA2_15130_c0_seq1:86-1003(+)
MFRNDHSSSPLIADFGRAVLSQGLSILNKKGGFLSKPAGGSTGFRQSIGMDPRYHQRWFQLDGKDLVYWLQKMDADSGRPPRGVYLLEDMIDCQAAGKILTIYFWETHKVAGNDVLSFILIAPSENDSQNWESLIKPAIPVWEGLAGIARPKIELLSRTFQQDFNKISTSTQVLSQIYHSYSSSTNDLSGAELRRLLVDSLRVRCILLLEEATVEIETGKDSVLLDDKILLEDKIRLHRDRFKFLKSKEAAVSDRHIDECRKHLIGNRHAIVNDPSTALSDRLFQQYAIDVLFSYGSVPAIFDDD